MELIRLSLSHWRHGTASERKMFADKLVKGFATRGFIKLDDHGFDEEAVREMFEWNRRFFAMDEELRNECAHVPGPYPQRGYSAVGGENFATYHSKWTGEKAPAGKRDHKELYDVGPEDDVDFPNRWPNRDALPGFQEYMETSFREFNQTTIDLLEALEMGLNIPEGSFTGRCNHDSSEFRLIHYPPLTAEEVQGNLVSRAWPHYDIGVISLLFQDDVGGLEIDDGNGGFAPVVSDKPTDLIINAAETIQRWSNGILKAGLHRVTVPLSMKGEDKGSMPTRRSVVYFCKPNRDASVAPVPELLNAQHCPKFEEMTFFAYHQQRIQSAYA